MASEIETCKDFFLRIENILIFSDFWESFRGDTLGGRISSFGFDGEKFGFLF